MPATTHRQKRCAARAIFATPFALSQRSRALATLFAVAALSQSGLANAQALNKCTDAQGKTTYTDQPCAQIKAGTAVVESKVTTTAPASDAAAYKARLAKQTEEVDQRTATRIANDNARIAANLGAAQSARAANCRQAARDVQSGQSWADSRSGAVRADAHAELNRGVAAMIANDCASGNDLDDMRRAAAKRIESTGGQVDTALKGRVNK